jgi:2-polyprenyl-3-methyl-5-hydroxy-6-metoxy-1,4-benzoquinol methylase
MVFTSHTLEHVYNLWEVLSNLGKVIVPGGILLAIVPNGGGLAARQFGVRWGWFIGETHTIAFTAQWFQQNLHRHGFEVVEVFSPLSAGRDLVCDGDELICVARYRGVPK